MTRPRGFALIIVLWAVVALGLGAAILTSTGRRTLDEAEAAGRQARAAADLDAAVAQTVSHLLARSDARWPASGTRAVRAGESTVDVTIINQAGFLNPNTATPALIAAVLVALDERNADAAALANNIVEWRSKAQPNQDAAARYQAAGLGYAPPNAPLQTLSELRLVLGMKPALFARLEPLLTLWHDGDPDPALAPPPIRAAIRSLGMSSASTSADKAGAAGTDAVALLCRIRTGPARVARRLVVQLRPDANPPFNVVQSNALALD